MTEPLAIFICGWFAGFVSAMIYVYFQFFHMTGDNEIGD